MRRNDYDVTDTIRTTDAKTVGAEVQRLCKALFDGVDSPEIERAFRDVAIMYRGAHPEYQACDTGYHDLQHVLDVTLAMARLMDGYERSRASGERLTRELFVVGTLAALFHDFGYLRKRNDRTRRHGAEYTLTHVSRSAQFLRRYLRLLGLARMAPIASLLVHYTGYERSTDTLPLSDPLLRRIGHMLGTADIIAQMSDRCYLEKCRDRLYPEFVIGARAGGRPPAARALPQFASGDDLVHRTPAFYATAARRLDVQLASAYHYAMHHFGGQNLYLEALQKNVRYAALVAGAPAAEALRRQPPSTLSLIAPAEAGSTPRAPSSAPTARAPESPEEP